MKSTARLPDLSNIESGISQKKDVETNSNSKNNEGEEVPIKQEPFGILELQVAWKKFAEIRKKVGKAQEQNLYVQPFELSEDGSTVVLELTNPLQNDILNEVKSDLVQYLRSQLQNDTIIIKSDLKKENGKKMLYTSKEKLEYLAQKNPAVQDLQQLLGLDPDF